MPPQIKQAKECPFCDTEKIKSHIVYDYDNVIAFEPLHPVVKGHLLVVPKIHTEDFTEDPDITANTVRVASLIAGERGGDYNLITSKGKCATQSVFHLHIHLVPRKEKDGLMLPWSSSSQAKLETLEAIIKEVEGMDRYDMNGYPDVGYYIEGVEDGGYIKREDLLTKLNEQLTLLKNER